MKIGIIVGSVREGRVGLSVGEWAKAIADRRSDAEFELIDLKSFGVPVFDSATNPMMAKKEYASDAVRAWSAAVDACDAFVFVTPEYNHGVPGGFKNAVDSLGPEWVGKAVAFVSYGADNGVRAVEQWRQIVANFSMVDVRGQLSLNRFAEFGDNGFAPNERREGEFGGVLDQLIAMAGKLSA